MRKNSLKYYICFMIFILQFSLVACQGKISSGNVFEQSNHHNVKENADKSVADSKEDNTSVYLENDASEGENDKKISKNTDDEETSTAQQIKEFSNFLASRDTALVQKFLQDLPDNGDELAEKGFVTIAWDGVLNLDRYWWFEQQYESGQACDVIFVQYTDEGDPVFAYVFFDGNDIFYAIDSTKDKWGDPNHSYVEHTYRYMYEFVQRAEEKDRLKTVVLSDRENLTYEDFETEYYSNGEEEKESRFVVSFFYVE